MPFTYDYPRPTVTVDAVIFRTGHTGPEVLLVKRGNPPFKDMWAIPGGFIEMDEELEDAAKRELEEETGIKDVALLQFGVYGAVGRDPRHRTISVVYAGFLKDNTMEAKANDDAADCMWFSIDKIPHLGFDHDKVITDAVSFAKSHNWLNT